MTLYPTDLVTVALPTVLALVFLIRHLRSPVRQSRRWYAE